MNSHRFTDSTFEMIDSLRRRLARKRRIFTIAWLAALAIGAGFGIYNGITNRPTTLEQQVRQSVEAGRL